MSKKTKIEPVFVKLAKDNNLEVDKVLEMYKEAMIQLETQGVTGNLDHLAINGVRNQIRRLTRKNEFVPKAKAVPVVGFIIGDGGLWDKIEQIRSKAKAYADKNGIEAAIEQNLINGDNQVLDSRQKIFGKDNPHYLEPLDEKVRDRTRTLHLIAKLPYTEKEYENGKTPEEHKWKYGTLQTNDASLSVAWGKVKFLTPCTTFAIVKEELDNEFKLNSSQAEDTTTVFKALPKNADIEDISKVFLEVIEPQLTKIKDLEKLHEALKNAWDRRVFVKGMVTWINRDRPNYWGDIYMGLMDTETDEEVKVKIPEHLMADFGENSEVIVIGKTDREDLREDDEEKHTTKWLKGKGAVIVSAVGFYPLLVTPATMNTRTAEETEESIEGWIEE